MIDQKQIKPKGDVEELLRFVGYDRAKAEKIRDEPILAEFTERLRKEGYTLSLLNDFAARLRGKNYDPNYIAGAIALLLSRRLLEAKKEFTLERQIRLIEKLPGQIAKAVAEELEKISLCTTSKFWGDVITIDLSTGRATPQLLGSYPGGDCLFALPDSTGNATISLDSAAGYGYRMGVGATYRKVRASFDSLFVQNAIQAGLFLYLSVGRGDISIEPWA